MIELKVLAVDFNLYGVGRHKIYSEKVDKTISQRWFYSMDITGLAFDEDSGNFDFISVFDNHQECSDSAIDSIKSRIGMLEDQIDDLRVNLEKLK